MTHGMPPEALELRRQMGEYINAPTGNVRGQEAAQRLHEEAQRRLMTQCPHPFLISDGPPLAAQSVAHACVVCGAVTAGAPQTQHSRVVHSIDIERPNSSKPNLTLHDVIHAYMRLPDFGAVRRRFLQA